MIIDVLFENVFLHKIMKVFFHFSLKMIVHPLLLTVHSEAPIGSNEKHERYKTRSGMSNEGSKNK